MVIRMKKTLASLMVVSVLMGVVNFSDAAETVKVPVGTPVTLSLLQEVSSKTATVGQRVMFTVAADVNIEGKTVIKQGASAIGEVTAASSVGMVGSAGELTVTLHTVTAADSTMIPISATKGAQGQSKLATSVAISALCCIFALFMKGKDVTFAQGTIYDAYTLALSEVKVQ